MPISRYEIRNEYSLADPELYRSADKNDPEAILEGVAMAGMVGVLRQLGDLAEFSAEIFHNLHEEIMATAARGHSLMVRVEQLESEVPSIERAFLSQTDHSSLFYNDGIDWRSNLRLDENLVARGDLPRFIMDSYEECRPPPRLFLLDKFDVAGAGACLKRYTDPSVFKVETSRMTNSDVQREKKILKPKKHLRRRNGDTPEITSTRTKLHQLLSEDGAEYGASNPARRVKLKRKLNGFPFDLKTGKSYMEKILKTSSPDHQFDKVIENHLPPLVSSNSDQKESRAEVAEIHPGGTDEKSLVRRSSHLSETIAEIVPNPSLGETAKIQADEKVIGEKVIAVDAERRRELSSTSYESDNISCEMENFVDAFVTLESDTDTESMCRTKNDLASTNVNSQQLVSDASKEPVNQRSSGSRSTVDSLVSDERKEISSFYSSDSPVTSAENSHLQKPAEGFSSAEIVTDASTLRRSAGNAFSVDRDSHPTACYGTHSRTDSSNSHTSDFEMLTSRLHRNESISSSAYSDPGVVTKHMLRQPSSDETAINFDDNERAVNQTIDVPYDHPSISDSELRHEDESDHKDVSLGENKSSRLHKLSVRSRRTIGARKSGLSKNLVAGKTKDKFSALHERLSSGCSDKAHHRNNVPFEETSTNKAITYKHDNGDITLTVGAPSRDYFSDLMAPSLGKKRTAYDERDSSISSEENQIIPEELIVPQEAKSEEDAVKPDPSIELDEVILPTRLMAQEPDEISDSEINRISSEKLILSQGANSEEDAGKPDHSFEDEVILPTRLVGQEVDEISDSEMNQISSEKVIFPQGANYEEDAGKPDHSLELGEVILPTMLVGQEVNETSDSEENHISSEKLISSQEAKSEENAGKPDPSSEMDTVLLPTRLVGEDVNEISDSADLKLLNKVCLDSDEPGLEGDKSSHIDSVVLSVDNDNEESKAQVNIGLPASQLNQEFPHSAELSLQKLDNGDHKSASDSTFAPSIDRLNFRPVSNSSEQSNNDLDVPELPREFGVNQINLDEDVHVPPLPPMQWRMGSLNSTSSYNEAEVGKLELSQQSGSSLTSDSASSLQSTLPEELSSSQLFTPVEDANFLQREQPALVQITGKATSEKVGFEISSACSESSDNHEMLGHSQTPVNESMLPAEKDAPSTYTEDLPHTSNTHVEDSAAALDKSNPSEVTVQVNPEVQNIEESNSLSEQIRDNDMPETIDLPHVMKNNEEQVVTSPLQSEAMSPTEDGVTHRFHDGKLTEPVTSVVDATTFNKSEVSNNDMLETVLQEFPTTTQDGEAMSPAEDRFAHESHGGELPEPGATLVKDVTLDKSEPRNVLERSMIEIQKVDESESPLKEMSADDANKTFMLTPARKSIRPVGEDAAEIQKVGEIESPLKETSADDANKTVVTSIHETKSIRPADEDATEIQKVDQIESSLEETSADDANKTIVTSTPERKSDDDAIEIQKADEMESPLTETSGDDANKLIVTSTPERKSIRPADEDTIEIQKVDGTESASKETSADDANKTIVTPTPERKSIHPADEDAIETQKVDEIESSLKETSVDDASKTIVMPTPERESIRPADKDDINSDKTQVRDASEQKVDGGDSLLEEVTTKDALQTIDLPPKIESKPQEIVDPKPVRESTSESKENEAVHDSHTVKQPLPRNPLVQDKSVLDKTKLKKATERGIPQMPKLDEHNSFLEQIRSKSFNLKRAASSARPTNPSRPPATNIRVAAMLEKAKTIRLAMAGGSDEDDEDSWSDDSQR